MFRHFGCGFAALCLCVAATAFFRLKGVLQRCDHNREAMLVQSVDTALLADAESAYVIRQHLKKGLSLDA
jgi:hypothetical protein